MAKAVLKAAGGLSAADKETVKEWMVEGHEILRGRVAGSIPARGAATITPGTSDQIIPAGLYLNGEQTIRGDAGLIPENIRGGANIFGVTGVLPAAGVVGIFGLCGGEWYADWSYGGKWSTYGPTFAGSCISQIPAETTPDGTRSRTYSTTVTTAFTGVVQISCSRSFNVSVTSGNLSFSSTSSGDKVSEEHVFNLGDKINISWNNGQRPYGIMLLVMFLRTK